MTPGGHRYGENRLATIQRKNITDALAGKTPIMQKVWMKALRHLIAFAIEQGECKTDPTIGIKTARPPKSSGHMTWGDVQIEQYRERHANGTMARLALELMLNIAARRHDAHLIGRQHLRNGCLSWRPSKTSQTTGKVLTIRVLPELQAALDAMPHSDALTFLLTEYGRPFASAAAFGNKFADWCNAAGLEPVRLRRRQDAQLSGPRSTQGGVQATRTRRMYRAGNHGGERSRHAVRGAGVSSTRSNRIGWPRRRWSSALPDQNGHRPVTDVYGKGD